MSVLLRARLASFATGVAVTSVYAIYQLKRDLQESHELVAKQATASAQELDQRVAKLEAAVAALQQQTQ